MKEIGEIEGYINQVVVSELIYLYLRLKTGKDSILLKRNPEFVKNVDLNPVYELIDLFDELSSSKVVTKLSNQIISKYGLLPNDALIAATCKHYGIKKIATFDEDFKRVDFLEVLEL
ncbi:MAG: PIN domain-containing protein [Archaeoglobaceae archaeon]|nr:PIN domain-containing protein [Archaeoglobaceae archaeon]MDW8128876.1 type II toxin-antitoxin system VapC family toxin [Archaeoglobaceae archaeon]